MHYNDLGLCALRPLLPALPSFIGEKPIWMSCACFELYEVFQKPFPG